MSADVAYARRIAALHEQLGIPADYSLRRLLDVQPEATELETVGRSGSSNDCLLVPRAARAWREMQICAQHEAEITLLPLSGFRSVDRQVEIIRGKLALGETIDEILRVIAAPGYSEHHTGRAVDVGAPEVLPLEEAFADTRAYAWLERHAERFGFHLSYPRENAHGLIFEPWHWCWRA
jgi:zinc D-Ala-D-Ala carboxypeptidase